MRACRRDLRGSTDAATSMHKRIHSCPGGTRPAVVALTGWELYGRRHGTHMTDRVDRPVALLLEPPELVAVNGEGLSTLKFLHAKVHSTVLCCSHPRTVRCASRRLRTPCGADSRAKLGNCDQSGERGICGSRLERALLTLDARRCHQVPIHHRRDAADASPVAISAPATALHMHTQAPLAPPTRNACMHEVSSEAARDARNLWHPRSTLSSLCIPCALHTRVP